MRDLELSLNLPAPSDGPLPPCVSACRKGTLPGAATCAALDPFEHAVYFGSEDGSVYFVDLLTGTPAPQLEVRRAPPLLCLR